MTSSPSLVLLVLLSLDFQLARTVSKTVLMDAELIQHAQQQVRHWRMRRRHDVTVTLELARGASQQDDGQWIMIMLVSVAHAAAVEKQRVIQ
jgi:hypothetical protein